MSSWSDLSIKDRADIMKVAVRNGITKLSDIRDEYNAFAEGGNTTPIGYKKWKQALAARKGINTNDPGYDYESYYRDNPGDAWRMLAGDPRAHFPDDYKTVYHPTFSTLSKYSGVKDPVHNPEGLVGGTWNGNVFTMSEDGYRGPVSMDERIQYLEATEDNGAQLREADGSLPYLDDGTFWQGVLPAVNVVGKHKAEGGNLYDGGGYFGKIAKATKDKLNNVEKKASRPTYNGSWISQHQRRWYDYLLRQGVSGQDAQRLSGFFAAQDALESAGGTSPAARTKNNFGGMQKSGKNIYYASPEAYMDAKWRMMNRTFSDALGAKTIDEYATLLGDPSRVGRGRSLYYVTDKVALDAKSPIWQAAQTKHMHDYINGMRTWAGKGRINFNDPDVSTTYVPEIPEEYVFPDEMQAFQNFQPSNPQAFFNTPEYYENLRALYTPEEGPITKAAEEYSQAELVKAEKQQGINNFFTIMNLMNQGSNTSSSQPESDFLAPIASLTGVSPKTNSLYQMGNLFLYGGDKGQEMTRVRLSDGSYAYVRTKDGHAITDGTGRYPLYNSSGIVIGTGVGDSFPYVGDVRDEGFLDEITVTPQGMQTQDTTYSADVLLKSAQQAERNKEIARNKAIDAEVSQYAFTPEGFFGQAMQPMNLLSPTHVGRSIYNISTGSGYGDFWKDVFLPNSGVFSDEFAREHPYWTMAGNMMTDALAFGTGAALWKMPKYRAAMQAENRVAQEAVANSWEEMLNSNAARAVTKVEDDWTRSLPGAKDYSLTRVEPYSGYTPTNQSAAYQNFVDDVEQGASWGRNRGPVNPTKDRDFGSGIPDLKPIGSGAEARVMEDPNNPSRVLKFNFDYDLSARNRAEALRNAEQFAAKRNVAPYNMPLSVEGTYENYGSFYPVFSQERVTPIGSENAYTVRGKLGELNNSVNGSGWYPGPIRTNSILSENDIARTLDFKPENLGITEDGSLVGIDLGIDYRGQLPSSQYPIKITPENAASRYSWLPWLLGEGTAATLYGNGQE